MLCAEGRATIRPRRRLLDLRGETQKHILASIGPYKLYADRHTIGCHVQRQRDRGIAGDVPRNRERTDAGLPPSDLNWMLVRPKLENPNRWCGSRERSGHEDIEA